MEKSLGMLYCNVCSTVIEGYKKKVIKHSSQKFLPLSLLQMSPKRCLQVAKRPAKHQSFLGQSIRISLFRLWNLKFFCGGNSHSDYEGKRFSTFVGNFSPRKLFYGEKML
ncbi:hypothetical protein NPIL_382541 [Nephila pilipes]|uniref:Uncharacterized protein n=1 Tax=Nephila pilipes TaxID=299642 RepID=A0A8X6QHE4_NEPPI|nr:hypothetical protein NPIL_382541 [Nephila pilipes]